MKKFLSFSIAVCVTLALTALPVLASDASPAAVKPSPDKIIDTLKQGNARFVKGKSTHPHTNSARLIQAGKESQANHALATVLSCSDSRVPVERIFDAGVMDLFVVRVAGNVCDTDEAGTIEYGLSHVKTPVLVVMGHTQCGAVKAVSQVVQGQKLALERNIPPLVDNIQPAVKRAMEKNPQIKDEKIIPAATDENICQSIEDLFMASPSTRELVKNKAVKVAGALYDVGTGKVSWLPDEKVGEILAAVEANPKKATNAMAE